MRFIVSILTVLAILLGGFAFGMYSTIKQNAVFDSVVFTARGVKAGLAGTSGAPQDVIQLDFADRALVDTNRLPFNQQEIRVSFGSGQQQQIVAVVKTTDTAAIVISQKGILFSFEPKKCDNPDCMQPVGRLVRADGSELDDIYDLISVPGTAGTDFYVSFGQENQAGDAKAFHVARFRLSDNPSADDVYGVEDVVFKSSPFTLEYGHADVSGGGALAYDAGADRLVMTIGDFGLNGYANRFDGDVPPSQDLASDLGKVHAVNLRTGITEVISIGHRNPQGLTITRDGEIVSTEHGPKGGDEVNILLSGKNYGWPRTSFGTLYEQYTFPSEPVDAGLPHDGYQPPLTAFVPSVGISALIEVQGLHAAWDGDLLIGSLKAQSLFRIRRWDGGHYIEQVHVGDRVRDLEIVDGVLLIASDAGKVYMLTPLEDVEKLRTGVGLTANKNVLSECGQCHNLTSARSTEFAPHLVNVASRSIASLTDFESYSEGLLSRKDEIWTQDNLRSFLEDPQSFAPGIAMPAMNLSAADMNELLELLPILR